MSSQNTRERRNGMKRKQETLKTVLFAFCLLVATHVQGSCHERALRELCERSWKPREARANCAFQQGSWGTPAQIQEEKHSKRTVTGRTKGDVETFITVEKDQQMWRRWGSQAPEQQERRYSGLNPWAC